MKKSILVYFMAFVLSVGLCFAIVGHNADQIFSGTFPSGTYNFLGVLQSGGNPVLTEVNWTDINNRPAGLDDGDQVDSLWTQSGSNIYYSSGMVGIGFSAPESILFVAGVSPVTDFTAGTDPVSTLVLRNDNETAGTGPALTFASTYSGNNDVALARIFAERQNTGATHAAASDLIFEVGVDATAALAERMRIDTDGNVGIGTTPSSARLKVTGSVELGASGNEASGEYAMAFGRAVNASGARSVAMGYGSKAIATTSVAMNRDTVAAGESSVAMGHQTEANADYSTAMGRIAKANGVNSIALGYLAQANEDRSVSIGYKTSSGGLASVALGYETNSSASYSTAMGRSTIASGDYSTAMGYLTQASGSRSTAIGYLTQANGIASTAMGREITVTGDNSFGIGLNDPASNYVVSQASTMAIMGGKVGINVVDPDVALEINGDIKASGLAGSGNAYACLDANGKLYRSATACS